MSLRIEADRTSGRPVRLQRFRKTLETAISWCTELPSVALLVAEVVLLLANVLSRYVFHKPLIWGDELASLLFIWLAMFGSVVALQRGEHMRLTFFLGRMTPVWKSFFWCFGNIVVVAFVIMLTVPAWEYASDQLIIITPALQISDALRVGAIPIGATMMLVLAIIRLIENAGLRDLLLSIAAIAALYIVGVTAKPIFVELGKLNLILFFLFGVSALVAIGVPIFVAFGISTLAFLSCSTTVPLTIVPSRMDEGMSNIVLLAVPLFVLLGGLIEAFGLASAMIRFLVTLIGHVRGGLAYVLIGAVYLVAGISGSKVADMAAVAPILFPEMKKRGADDGDLVAILGASAAMSETIPPSVVLITIGSVTGVSIAALFTGGFMPAVIGALALAVVVWLKSRKEVIEGLRRATPREILKAFFVALPALALPFIIRTAVVEGVATATEVSTIGVVYTIVVGLILYRQFKWNRLIPMLIESASLSGAILIIIGSATAMAWALSQSGFSRGLSDLIVSMPGGAAEFMIVSMLAFILLGSFLEGIPAIVLFGPVLFPVAKAVGIHEVHYAMVTIFAMGLGLFAPPFGVGFFAACAVGRVNPDEVMGRVWPYLGALFVALIIIAIFPWLSIGFLTFR